jgi:hypothetical protein
MRDLRESVKYLWANSRGSVNLPLFCLRAGQKPKVIAFCVFSLQRSDRLSEDVDVSHPVGVGDPGTVSLRELVSPIPAAWI